MSLDNLSNHLLIMIADFAYTPPRPNMKLCLNTVPSSRDEWSKEEDELYTFWMENT